MMKLFSMKIFLLRNVHLMSLILACSCSIFFSCTQQEKTRQGYKKHVDKDLNEGLKVKTYIRKVISFHDHNRDFGKVSLSADTLVPNYYIEYNKVKYRIDSHLFHQRGINFDYDILENKQVSQSYYGSFILFFGEPLDVFQNKTQDGLYHYTIFNISKNHRVIPSKYYRLYKFGNEKISKNDTIASLTMTKINNMSIEEYFNKENDFTLLEGVKEVNYLLRNGKWTKEPTDKAESRIMKHFAALI